MNKEDKSLILQDLCARLPYGVISLIHNVNGDDYNRSIIGGDIDLFSHHFITIKPYLRPMSSMADEEEETYYNLCDEEEREEFEFGEWLGRIHYHDTIDSIDWLNAHHFDYRGLIEKGLALEAPVGMYVKLH